VISDRALGCEIVVLGSGGVLGLPCISCDTVDYLFWTTVLYLSLGLVIILVVYRQAYFITHTVYPIKALYSHKSFSPCFPASRHIAQRPQHPCI